MSAVDCIDDVSLVLEHWLGLLGRGAIIPDGSITPEVDVEIERLRPPGPAGPTFFCDGELVESIDTGMGVELDMEMARDA